MVDQPKYCFIPSQSNTWVDVFLTFPQSINFSATSYEIKTSLLIDQNLSSGSPCLNTENSENGNEAGGTTKADSGNNIYFQIGSGL